MNLDWTTDTVQAYSARSERRPDVLVNFFRLPLTSDDERSLEGLLTEAERNRAIALVTLEPNDGLAAVDERALTALVRVLRGPAERGVPVLVRFAHEMNGSWYAWGQQPTAYREAFRRVARAVHAVPGAATLWAPNYGGGYPFRGGKYEAQPGTTDRSLLDTNHDGEVDTRDDPYEPYYPGDDAVDWVGLSLYHWGNAYPWGANVVPAPGKFVTELTGQANQAGDSVPDFYQAYAARTGKPLAIPETAALYRPGGGGASESSVKQEWMRQVLDASRTSRYPLLRMVNWFEWRKTESEIGGAIIDWRATANPEVAADFANLSAGWRTAP